MTRSNLRQFLATNPGTILVARRIDISDNGEIVGLYRRGIDGIFFTPGTIEALRADPMVGQFQLGAPYWDIVLPVIASFHHRLQFVASPLLCHELHPPQWDEADYRRLRTHAVAAVVENAKRHRLASPMANEFLVGLDRHLSARRPRRVVSVEKCTAEYMGLYLSHLERTSSVSLHVNLNDAYLRPGLDRLLAISPNGLELSRLVDSIEEGRPTPRWPAAISAVLHSLRRSVRSRRRLQSFDSRMRDVRRDDTES
jgi:hypothetical protein